MSLQLPFAAHLYATIEVSKRYLTSCPKQVLSQYQKLYGWQDQQDAAKRELHSKRVWLEEQYGQAQVQLCNGLTDMMPTQQLFSMTSELAESILPIYYEYSTDIQ